MEGDCDTIKADPANDQGSPTIMAFQIFSSAFTEGGWIPELHSCQGADLSPSL